MTRKERKVSRIKSNYMEQYDAFLERQNRKKKRLFRRLILFAIVAVLSFGTIVTYHVKQRSLYTEKQQKYEQLEQEMTSLKQEEKELKQEVELLKDEDYVLQIAKTNYFFSEEGEIIFKIPEEDLSY